MRQNVKRRARNFPVRSELKSLMKKELGYIKDGKVEEAVKFLPGVYSVIDMACKKNILHPNNAARKKSRLARALNELQGKGGAKAVAGEESKVGAVKAEKKVEEKVEEKAAAEAPVK